MPRGTLGNIVVKLPLPPSALPTLWNADQRFRDAYLSEFPGYYKTADAGFIDDDGYAFIMSRTDDIINVAGHRLSTGAMEEVLAGHPDVAECAVIGVADALKGQVPHGFVVLKAGKARAADELQVECVKLRARGDRAGRGLPHRPHHQAAAEDAVGKNPSRHDAPDRRRRVAESAGDDRRPGDFGGNTKCAERVGEVRGWMPAIC